MSAPRVLEIDVMGSVELRCDGNAVLEAQLGGRRVRLVLAVLTLERGHAVTRDQLADVLWPDELPSTWGAGLRVVLSQVRAAIARLLPHGDPVPHHLGGYRLVVPDGVSVEVDVDLALAALTDAEAALTDGDASEAARDATRARAILARPFLPGDEGPWVTARRRVIDDAHFRSLITLAVARLELGEGPAAAAAAIEAVRLEPYLESAHRTVIAAYAASGNRAEALRAYERCRRLFADELGVAPSHETEELYVSLLGDEPERRPVGGPGELRFVGRARPLERLEHLVTTAAAGRGGAALITGEAGIGKSRLARELAAAAREKGVAVLWGTCREPDWAPPYSAVSDILPGLAGLAPPELVSRLERRLGEEIPTPTADRFAVLEDFRRVVVEVSRAQPLLIVLDDLHWADAGTAGALRHLAPSLPQLPVAVVATARDGASDGAIDPVIAALTRDAGLVRVELGALEVGAVEELVDSISPGAGVTLGAALATLTGGNTFFLEVSLLDLIESGALSPRQAPAVEDLLRHVPKVAREVIEARVGRLGDGAQSLLRVGSLFEGVFLLDVAAVAAGLVEADALDAIDDALTAQLLVAAERPDAYRFVHGLARSAVAAALTPSRRVRLHRRIAETIEAVRGDVPSVQDCGELAGQFHRSRSLAGASRGVEPALRAADHASATGAFDKAATYLGMALDLLPPGDARVAGLLGRRGLALISATDYDAGAELVLAAAESADDPAALVAEGAWTAEMSGGSAAAFRLAAAGIEMIDPGRRDDAWARLYVLDLRRQEAQDPRGIGLPIATTDRRTAARLLSKHPRFRDDLIWAVWDHRDEVIESGTTDPAALTYWAGDYRGALPGWQRKATSSEARGHVSAAVHAWAGAARCAVALGHFDDADTMAEHALGLARRIDLRGSFALHLLGARDDLTHARADGFDTLWTWSRLLTSERTDPTQRWAEAQFFAAAARTFALEGRVEDVRSMLEPVLEVLPLAPAWAVGVSSLVGDAVAAAWLAGGAVDLKVLESAVRDKLLATDFRSPMQDPRLAMGRVVGLAGRVEEAVGWFDKARRVCDEDGLRPLRAIVDHDHATLLVRQGDGAAVAEYASAAAEEFAALEMVGWLARADRLLLTAR